MRTSAVDTKRAWREQGFALVAVLGGLLVFSLIAASILMGSQSGTRLSQVYFERAQLDQALDAGFNRGLFELLQSRPRGQAVHNLRMGFEIDGIEVETVILDEAARVDFNAGLPGTLAQLLTSLGADPEEAPRLADRIADWRDGDDFTRNLGAERRDYLAEGLLPPGNRPFYSLGELTQVMGISPDTVDCVRPFATLYARRQSPDLRFMSSDLRALWGLDPAQGTQLSALSGASPAAFSSGGRAYSIGVTATADTGRARLAETIVLVTGNSQEPYFILNSRQDTQASGAESCARAFPQDE